MNAIEQSWQSRGFLACLLWPLAQIFGLLIAARRFLYTHEVIKAKPVSLPVVVVGNLSVGGTGKTPLCAKIVDVFESEGWHPAIVSRGYGGSNEKSPLLVSETDSADRVGDEPLMLHRITKVPVCVCVDRAAAVNYIAHHTAADIIISDDGLQHLAMPRVAQIIVIDSQRGFMNRWLLPAGPLRERLDRLNEADLIALQTRDAAGSSWHDSLDSVFAGPAMAPMRDNTFYLQPKAAIALSDGRQSSLSSFRKKPVHAMAGIGNPDRFFDALRSEGLTVLEHPVPDHHKYKTEDFDFSNQLPIMVTAKDAVKLRSMKGLPESVFSLIHEVSTRIILSHELDV
ncbi:MAG: tetraacyldisaccharide 4'-kinase, partial [Granulosicoccus sp.]|nr:tetraacyldisaccharide 4'-kinase [Granulosicoccus sp.]